MEFSENFQKNEENPILKFPKIDRKESSKENLNQRYNQLEPLKERDKSSLTIQPTDSSIDIISNLLKKKPIYNKIYSKVNKSRDIKRHNFKLSANEIINSYQNDEKLFKRKNCPAKEIKINLLITEIDKNDSLKNSIHNKNSKSNLMPVEYYLFNNKINRGFEKEKSKINPKIANLLVHSPGEWKKARNCSLKFLYNKNKKSIGEVTELLQNIDERVKITFAKFKKTAEKDFDDIFYL